MSNTFRFPPPPPPPPPPSTVSSKPAQFLESRGRGRGRGYRGQRGHSNSGGVQRPIDRSQSHFNNKDLASSGSSATQDANLSHSTREDRYFNRYKKSRGLQSDRIDGANQSNYGATVSSKPPKVKAEVPPEVPRFGAPICSTIPRPETKTKSENPYQTGERPLVSTRKRKRLANQLGLTPQGECSDGSEQQDTDEEAGHASCANELLQVEYGGQISVLKTSEDIAAWIAERKKRWPTRARIEEKERIQAEREEQVRANRREETQRLVSMKMAKEAERRKAREMKSGQTVCSPQQHESDTLPLKLVPTVVAGDEKVEKQKLKLEKLRQKLERHEAKLAKLSLSQFKDQLDDGDTISHIAKDPFSHRQSIENSNQESWSSQKTLATAAPQTGVERDEVQTTHKIMELIIPSHSDEESVASTSEASRSLSSSLSSGSDSDGSESISVDADSLPEEVSSKHQRSNLSQTLGESHVEDTRKRKQLICRTLRKYGSCRRGDTCWYSHDLSSLKREVQNKEKKRFAGSSTASKRKSLYQRMLEKEIEDENRFALQVIKRLGDSGYFDIAKSSL